jgi:PBP1b-binding outer membrane lipoprotein LpoB
MPSKKYLKLVAIALVLSGLLSGCTADAEPTAEPEVSNAPEFFFYPTGSATSNLPVFESVMKESGAGKPNHDLAKSIKLLRETGFSIEAITHTAVESKIGATVDSVSLAIAFKGECLIAQFSNTWLTTTVAEELPSGCLIGDVEKASLETDQ